MNQQLTLSVVDQSPIRDGGSAADALRETVELAVVAESLGYKRYWLAEHHSSSNFAGTSPEMLIGQVAARTNTIRVGSGGVMLSHYSALKVAENFRFLDTLFPGRIDVGVGRAPGSDRLTAAALSYPSQPKEIHHYPQQVTDLLGYLAGNLDDDHPFAEVKAGPRESPTVPDLWLLGSRYESAYLAARLGLPFAYAHFFGSGVEEGPAIIEGYRKQFQPSAYLSEPKINVGVQVLCAETEEEAIRIAATRNLGRLKSVLGRSNGIPNSEEAMSYKYRPDEWAFIQNYAKNCVDTDSEHVKQRLENIAEMYQTWDLSVVTICHNFKDRVHSYELVAEACGIKP